MSFHDSATFMTTGTNSQHDQLSTHNKKKSRRRSKSPKGSSSSSKSGNPILYLFKERKSSTSSKKSRYHRKKNKMLLAEAELRLADGNGSLESITSIISAITLPDELAPVPEAGASTKFHCCSGNGGDGCGNDRTPRKPLRRGSSFGLRK